MRFIIDAHNLFFFLEGQTFFSPGNFANKQEQFLRFFLKLSKKKKNRYMLVFDGQQEGHYQKQHKGDLTLVYALKNQTADACILNILEEENPDATVVSNDREVQERVKKRYRKKVMSCGEFLEFLDKKRPSSNPLEEVDHSKHYLFNHYLKLFEKEDKNTKN